LDISISPNPASNFVQISFNSEEAGNYKASISSITGAVIKESLYQQSYPGETYFEMNVADIPNGMYLLFISRNEELISGKKLMIVK